MQDPVFSIQCISWCMYVLVCMYYRVIMLQYEGNPGTYVDNQFLCMCKLVKGYENFTSFDYQRCFMINQCTRVNTGWSSLNFMRFIYRVKIDACRTCILIEFRKYFLNTYVVSLNSDF